MGKHAILRYVLLSSAMKCARVKHHCFAVDRESPAGVTCVVCSPNSWWYGKARHIT